ncbi:MAG: hypothetical protein AAFY11_05545, partial [Cyanobacteria bacterium J06641_5]
FAPASLGDFDIATDQLIDANQLLSSLSNGLFAISLGSGSAGDIALEVGELSVRDGAVISVTSFLPDFGGAGGQIELTATENVTIAGGSLLATGAISAVPSGDIQITTPQLRLLNSIAVSAAVGDGEGGDIAVMDASFVELAGSVVTEAAAIPGGLISATITSGPAGDVVVDTGTLVVRDQAIVLTNSVVGPGTSGNLTVMATEAVELSDSFPGIGLFSSLSASTSGLGDGGDITVTTPRLTLNNGGAIAANTFGPGDGGNLTINADRIEATSGGSIQSSTFGPGNGGAIAIRATEISLAGALSTNDPNALPQTSGISAITFDGGLGLPPVGNAGSIDVDLLNGGQLTVSSGASIATSTGPGTFGQGGPIDIDTGSTSTGAIVVEGLAEDASSNSIVSAFTFGEGLAGTVTLQAGDVRLEDGGVVAAGTIGLVPESAGGNIEVTADTIVLAGVPVEAPLATGFYTATLGVADAGDLILEARQISILDGTIATTSTIATGDSGLLSVTASDSLTVAGVGESGEIVSALISATLGTGNAGNLEIEVGGTLQVADEGFVGAGTNNPFLGEELVFFFPGIGFIPVPNAGSGGAGTATIAAEIIELDNGEIGIEAAGDALDGANEASLFLTVGENLFLFNNSEITATALSDSDGGNITIDVNEGSVVLNQGSSIAADAAAGNGGNIQINATGLFVCATCSVTASSNFGSDGIVAVTSPEVNPADSLTILPAQLNDPSEQIVTGCAAQKGNRFATVGRGGLPPNASDRLQLPEVWSDLRDVLATAPTANRPGERLGHSKGAGGIRPQTSVREPISETVGWYRHENGEIELLAAAGTTDWQSQHPHCGASGAASSTAAQTPPSLPELEVPLP